MPITKSVQRTLAAALVICCSLFVAVTHAYAATQGTTVGLIRFDRLPDLPGEVSSYELNVLPSTTERFMTVADVGRDASVAFPNGNIWVKEWEASTLGDAVIKQASAACNNYIATPDGHVSAIIPMHPGRPKQKLVYLFRDLSLTATYDITAYPNAWLVSISNDGKVVCRVSDTSKQAIFLLPDKKIDVRTFPGTFLNWDFAHSRAIINDERLMRVITAAQTDICSIKLPFVAAGAWPFHDGTIMARSRGIGADDGPAWRIVVDEQGQVKGEAVFGEWMLFPDYYVQGKLPLPTPPSSAVPQGRMTLRRVHSEFVTIVDGRLITRSLDLHDGILGRDAGVPASNALHEYNCLDSRGRLYALMNNAPPPGKENEDAGETVYLYDHDQPIPLVSSSEVAKIVGTPSVMLYSMTISPDGGRLALTVTPNGEGSWRQWWLVEYRIMHPQGVLP